MNISDQRRLLVGQILTIPSNPTRPMRVVHLNEVFVFVIIRDPEGRWQSDVMAIEFGRDPLNAAALSIPERHGLKAEATYA